MLCPLRKVAHIETLGNSTLINIDLGRSCYDLGLLLTVPFLAVKYVLGTLPWKLQHICNAATPPSVHSLLGNQQVPERQVMYTVQLNVHQSTTVS